MSVTNRETLPGFVDDDALFAEQERAAGIHTAELFAERQPEKAAKVREFLVAGALSGAEIARVCRCSRNTVAAMRRALIAGGALGVEHLKRQGSTGFASVRAHSLERLEEIFSDPTERAKVSAKDAAIIAGIVDDHFQLNAGQPTQRIEIDGGGEGDLAGMMRAIDAEVVTTHLPEGTGGQKASGEEAGDEFQAEELAEVEAMQQTETQASAEAAADE